MLIGQVLCDSVLRAVGGVVYVFVVVVVLWVDWCWDEEAGRGVLK